VPAAAAAAFLGWVRASSALQPRRAAGVCSQAENMTGLPDEDGRNIPMLLAYWPKGPWCSRCPLLLLLPSLVLVPLS
jgi:hypothetical protein